jgi:ferredoxin-like protein FixX
LNGVNEHIKQALNRESSNWRIKNACPACTYVLEDEPDLVFTMFGCMDGKNSLKRITCKSEDNNNIEQSDPRVITNDYYITRDDVNRFKHEVCKITSTMNNGSEVHIIVIIAAFLIDNKP